MPDRTPSIHESADVSRLARVGDGTRVWHYAQVREGASIGSNCVIGKGVYIDAGVEIGDNVKIQNQACVYHGSRIEGGVFIGPHVVLTNDEIPRSINIDGTLKTEADWEVGNILVKRGASLGACSVVLPGVTIGEWALIGAGSVVTRDIADYVLAFGNPARIRGVVCACGRPLDGDVGFEACGVCGTSYEISIAVDGATVVRRLEGER